VGLVSVLGPVVRLLLGFIPPAVAILASAFVYRVVPTPKPDWRALALPAIVAGVALTFLLEAFVFLAPRLIGAAALLGTIATASRRSPGSRCHSSVSAGPRAATASQRRRRRAARRPGPSRSDGRSGR
jgi:hypothetical protein